MLAIINYGLGNLRSISSALEKLKVEFICTNNKSDILKANSLILPGVGSFSDGIKNLNSMDLTETLNSLVIQKKIPILGICLGFQLMSKLGFENGKNKGLGWIDAEVDLLKNLPINCRVPHVGWNDCFENNEEYLFNGIPNKSLFYFTHSYHMICKEKNIITSLTNHGINFVSSIKKDNIFGTQFHPEKSQKYGLDLLLNFCKLSGEINA